MADLFNLSFSALSLAISALALFISAATAWLTFFRVGTVKMTQPTVIFFGPDAPSRDGDISSPKVFLRALLFSTSRRGRVIENMYVSLSQNGARHIFNIWAYGERNELVRGSGVFVGETGVEANHHFLISKGADSFRIIAGQYHIELYAQLLGDRRRILLFTQTLKITPTIAAMIKSPNTGLYFDWEPDASRYTPHVDKRPHPMTLRK